MTKTASKIRFRAKLFQPAATAKVGSWTFLTLPMDASAKLPSRGMTTVEGTIKGFPFRATLEPDGQRSHWLRVNRKMREAADADAGDVLTLEIAPSEEEPEPRVPADLRKALAAAPKARASWSDITTIARRDWRLLFGFWRGKRLREIEKRLKPGGKYEMATIELHEGDELEPAKVRRLVQKAVALNESLGDPTQVDK